MTELTRIICRLDMFEFKISLYEFWEIYASATKNPLCKVDDRGIIQETSHNS